MTGSTEKPEKLYLEKLEKVDGHSSEGADNANVSSKGVKKPCKSMDHAGPCASISFFALGKRPFSLRWHLPAQS